MEQDMAHKKHSGDDFKAQRRKVSVPTHEIHRKHYGDQFLIRVVIPFHTFSTSAFGLLTNVKTPA